MSVGGASAFTGLGFHCITSREPRHKEGKEGTEGMVEPERA